MKSIAKNFFAVIILFLFWAIPFTILYFILTKTNIAPNKYLPGLYLTTLIISGLYKKKWSFKTFNSKKGSLKFLFAFLVTSFIFVYLNTLAYRSYKLYEYIVTEKRRGWEGMAHQPDDTLGFKPIPNARAFHTFPIGDKIPMGYDMNGFRITLSDTLKQNIPGRTDLLFLGCSVTYGDACYAEQTFPYFVAKQTNLSYINAGVCSYGLSQMLILAERLIPKYKPRYVIVQYSKWLAERGASVYAPTYFAAQPNPYFVEKNNVTGLEYPVYHGQAFELDPVQLKKKYSGRFMQFFIEKGLSFYLKEDYQFQKNKILTLMGIRLRPLTDIPQIEKYAYGKIKTVADANEAKLIILNFGDIEYSKKSHLLFPGTDVHFAEADSALLLFLKTSPSKDYFKEFYHWRTNDSVPVLVDGHPNEKAHRVIANSIIKEITTH